MGATSEEKISLDDDVSTKSHQRSESTDRSSSESSYAASEGLLKEGRDLESQQPAPAEHYVSTKAKLFFLAAYFFLNLFLTLSNKSVLGQVREGLQMKHLVTTYLQSTRLIFHGCLPPATLPRRA